MAVLWGGLVVLAPARADSVYLAPADYVKASFPNPPRPKFLWLDKASQARVAEALGHPYPAARLRYWRDGARTVWILDEVGKEQPITAGFLVEADKIIDSKVLVYRESRGAEIRLPAFQKQFAGAGLNDQQKLNVEIDGITGATLSVHAMQRMAEAALILNRLAP